VNSSLGPFEPEGGLKDEGSNKVKKIECLLGLWKTFSSLNNFCCGYGQKS